MKVEDRVRLIMATLERDFPKFVASHRAELEATARDFAEQEERDGDSLPAVSQE